MANILLGVTGSVAAINTPELFEGFAAGGHAVRIVATEMATYFFDRNPFHHNKTLFLDNDEWPGLNEADRYKRGDSVLHIELRKWADLFVVAPLDANTLAKFAAGICDNCLTSVYRCWDVSKPIAVAPAMNTMMWEQPVTKRNLKQIQEDFPKLQVCWPQEKMLACGDVGTGAMADVSHIVESAVGFLKS